VQFRDSGFSGSPEDAEKGFGQRAIQNYGEKKGGRTMGTPIPSTRVAQTDGTWSQAVRAGNTLFISGQIALDADGNIVGKNDFAAQAEQVLENTRILLEEAGYAFEHVCKITVFLTDMNDRPAFAEIRKRFFSDNPPASTLVEVSKLAVPGLKIEMETTAVK
jgi:reactive intermediate/imine deaminase